MPNSNIFKKSILLSGGYKGGKSTDEINHSGRKLFKLSSNENYFGTSHLALEAIRQGVDHLNIYPSGTPQALYEELTSFYNNELEVNNFIATNSGSALIDLILRAFLEPGLHCIISNPCFSPYDMFSKWTGAIVTDVPLAGPGFELDVSGILESINSNTRIIFLTSPNNPTGTIIKKSRLRDLLENIPDHIVVIYDEVYYHFTESQEYTTALPFVKEGFPIIAINSFSKAHGLAGLRIGYGYSTPEIIGYLRKLLRPFLLNQLSMNAAIAALKDKEFILHTVTNIIEQRKCLISGLKKIGLQHWPSEANFVLIKTHLDEDKLTEQMLKNGIMVRPAGNFGAPGCIRITIGDQEATDATLTALATIFHT